MQPNTTTNSVPTEQSQQATGTNSGPAPKNRKPLIIALIVGGVLVIAAVVALILYLTMFNITKADYQRALDTTKSVNEKVEAINTAVGDLSSDDNSKLAEAKPKIEKAIEDARASMETLRKEKALNDQDVKAKSDAYLSKLDKAVIYLSDYSTDLGSLRVIINDCSTALEQPLSGGSNTALAQSLNQLGDKLNDCTSKLKDAEQKMKSEDIKALANSFIGPYDTIAEQSKQAAQAASSSNLAAYDQASTKMNQATVDMANDSAKVLEDVAAHIKDLDPDQAYGALVAVLEEKAK